MKTMKAGYKKEKVSKQSITILIPDKVCSFNNKNCLRYFQL